MLWQAALLVLRKSVIEDICVEMESDRQSETPVRKQGSRFVGVSVKLSLAPAELPQIQEETTSAIKSNLPLSLQPFHSKTINTLYMYRLQTQFKQACWPKKICSQNPSTAISRIANSEKHSEDNPLMLCRWIADQDLQSAIKASILYVHQDMGF